MALLGRIDSGAATGLVDGSTIDERFGKQALGSGM
jgi:hypothetical protein